MQLRARRPLDAVVGPEHLRPAVELDHVHRRFPLVAAREGDVAGRVPILGCHVEAEEVSFHQPADGLENRVSVLYR